MTQQEMFRLTRAAAAEMHVKGEPLPTWLYHRLAGLQQATGSELAAGMGTLANDLADALYRESAASLPACRHKAKQIISWEAKVVDGKLKLSRPAQVLSGARQVSSYSDLQRAHPKLAATISSVLNATDIPLARRVLQAQQALLGTVEEKHVARVVAGAAGRLGLRTTPEAVSVDEVQAVAWVCSRQDEIDEHIQQTWPKAATVPGSRPHPQVIANWAGTLRKLALRDGVLLPQELAVRLVRQRLEEALKQHRPAG
jgi:hypothetical protein